MAPGAPPDRAGRLCGCPWLSRAEGPVWQSCAQTTATKSHESTRRVKTQWTLATLGAQLSGPHGPHPEHRKRRVSANLRGACHRDGQLLPSLLLRLAASGRRVWKVRCCHHFAGDRKGSATASSEGSDVLWRWRRPTRVRRPNLGESVAKPPPTLPGRAKTGRWRKRKSLPDGPAPGNRQIHMFLFVYWSVHSFIREACSSSTPHCGRRSCLCSHPQIDSGPRKVHQFDHCALLVDGINRSSGFQRLNPTAFFSEPTCTVAVDYTATDACYSREVWQISLHGTPRSKTARSGVWRLDATGRKCAKETVRQQPFSLVASRPSSEGPLAAISRRFDRRGATNGPRARLNYGRFLGLAMASWPFILGSSGQTRCLFPARRRHESSCCRLVVRLDWCQCNKRDGLLTELTRKKRIDGAVFGPRPGADADRAVGLACVRHEPANVQYETINTAIACVTWVTWPFVAAAPLPP